MDFHRGRVGGPRRRGLTRMRGGDSLSGEVRLKTDIPADRETGYDMSVQIPTAEQSRACWHELSTLPRPREALLSQRAWVHCIGAALGTPIFFGFAVFFAASAGEHPGEPSWIPVAILLGLGAWAVVFLFSVRRRWRLFENGEVALGKVLAWEESGSHSRGRKWVTSWVLYEFALAPGVLVRGSVRDYTNSLYSEMPVNIFYDPERPSRGAVLEGSLFRIELPSGDRIP
jgi:hypothetical protein